MSCHRGPQRRSRRIRTLSSKFKQRTAFKLLVWDLWIKERGVLLVYLCSVVSIQWLNSLPFRPSSLNVTAGLRWQTSDSVEKSTGILKYNQNAVSICPAAGQVVENTPCPAVKFFVNFQFIMLNPCLYG